MTLNKHDDEEITIDTPVPVPVEPPIETTSVATPIETVASPIEATAILEQHTTCTIFAPATLEAGYTFPAKVDGIDFIVTVPEGGVTEGQAFQVPYPTSGTAAGTTTSSMGPLEVTSAPSQIPTGKWRNDIWDCFEVAHTGIFWQGWCCTPLLLGQIMTRSKLNPFGIPSDSYENTFYIMAALWGGYVIIFVIINAVVDAGGLTLAWLIFMTIVVANTRYIMRQRYQIPVKCCDGCGGRCDDICCGFWCACCVTIQMARHTHPHYDNPYVCCTPTGLLDGTPDIV